MPHSEHRRRAWQPLWSEALDKRPTSEEFEELESVRLTELLAEIGRTPALDRLRRPERLNVKLVEKAQAFPPIELDHLLGTTKKAEERKTPEGALLLSGMDPLYHERMESKR